MIHSFFGAHSLNIKARLEGRVRTVFVCRLKAGMPYALTLVMDTGEKILVRCKYVDTTGIDVGVLEFEKVDDLPVDSVELVLPRVLLDERQSHKITFSYNDDKFEVGFMLCGKNALPFIVMGGGMPATLAIFGGGNRPYECTPEFDLHEYEVESWV